MSWPQDALTNTTSYTYDQLGNQATATAADGGVTHTTYDLASEPLSVTDASGAQRQSTYDFVGRQITDTTLERYPTAQTLTTTYSYAASSSNPGGANLAAVTTPGGAVTQYGYNGAGQKVSSTDPAGNTTTYAYSFMDEPFTQTNPDGTSVAWQYDANQKLTDTRTYSTSALLTHQHNEYDAAGNQLSSTDPNGNTTTYTYDATGTLAQEVQPVTATTSITTSFGYDAAGNQTRYTDGRSNNWYTTYNPWNTKQTDVEPATTAWSTPAACTTTYAYDADGRLTNQTLPGGVTQSFGYDAMGNLTSQQGSGASAATANRSFTYDKLGRTLTANTSNTSGSGTSNATSESFTYNDRDDLLTAGGSAGSTTLGYNGDGLLASRSDASGTTSYGYDPYDRLKTVTDALTGTTQTYTSYNQLDQVTSINLGSGDVRNFSYDDLHRLTGDQIQTPGGTTVSSIGYGYDNNSNLTSKNTTGFGTPVNNTYTYDQADRLTSWNNGTTTVNYGYDAAGNRTQVGAKTFTYDARDQLTSDGTTGYSYTAAGVMSAQGSTTLTSDAYGQQTADGNVQYTYDALGRMTQRGAGGGSQAMQYSGAGNTLAADSQYLYSHDPSGNLLGVRTTAGTAATARLAVTDQHTDVVATMSATDTTLTQTAAYDPLGNAVGARTVLGNLGYQSEYTDGTSGKVNMASRWYNPGTGQFTSKDTLQVNPVPNSAAANPFAYAGEDPLLRTDPSGHMYNNNLGITPGKRTTPKATAKPKRQPVRHMGRPEDRLDRNDPDGFVAYHYTSKKQLKSLKTAAAAIERSQRSQRPGHQMGRPEDRLDGGDPDGFVAYHYTTKTQIQSLRDANSAIERSLIEQEKQALAVVNSAAADVDRSEKATSALSSYLNFEKDATVAFGGDALHLIADATPGGCMFFGTKECMNMVNPLPLLNRAKSIAECQFLLHNCLGMVKDQLSSIGCKGGFNGKCAGHAAFLIASVALTDGAEEGCSFSAGTLVLMSDGMTKPIDKLKIGESVKSTDPANGKVVDRAITALHNDVDTDMADVTVGDGKGHRAVLHTTQNHPFWDATTKQWTRADHLRAGDKLESTSKAAVTVLAVHNFSQSAHRFNLTVADIHTYYVVGGTTPILVHNCGQNQGIYEFDDQWNPGKTYVGKSVNLPRRLEYWVRQGRLSSVEDAVCTHICGTNADVFVAEHLRIEELQRQGVELSNGIASPGKKIYEQRKYEQLPLW